MFGRCFSGSLDFQLLLLHDLVRLGRILIDDPIGLIDDVVDLLLQLLDNGSIVIHHARQRGAFRLRWGVSLQVKCARVIACNPIGGRAANRFRGQRRRAGRTGGGQRNFYVAGRFLRHGVFHRLRPQIVGVAAEGFVGQLVGLVELAGVERDLGQPVQALSARFNLLLGIRQAVGVDQRQCLAAVDLGLIDETHEVTVLGVALRLGHVPGELLIAEIDADLFGHCLGAAHQHRLAIAAHRRKGLGINVHACREVGGLGPKDRAANGDGQGRADRVGADRG